MEPVKIVECPRDAWQGLPRTIPTEVKADYLRRLVAAGFRHLDAVGFFSTEHVPQMADSEAVMEALSPQSSALSTEVIGVVVNEKGLERALATPGVTTIGYPYSISAHFRRANANLSRKESRVLVEKINQASRAAGRSLVVYIVMAFGNPFEEPWGPEIVADTLAWLKDINVRTVSLADTAGKAEAELVAHVYSEVKDSVAGIELGVHLHSRPEGAEEKVLAAYAAGCRRFDCALTGLGDCPFAGDEFVGNLPTEVVVSTLAQQGASLDITPSGLAAAVEMTQELRRKYAYKVVQ